jgi:hypothetical protein
MFNGTQHSWIRCNLLVVLAIFAGLAAGCSDKAGSGDGGMGVSYELNPISETDFLVAPNDIKQPMVVLFQVDSGKKYPMSNKNITFTPIGTISDDTQITDKVKSTDTSGMAGTRVTVGIKADTFKLMASTPDIPNVQPVYFTFSVKPDILTLEIQGDKERTIKPVRKVALSVKANRIKYTHDTESGFVSMPLANEAITFQLVKSEPTIQLAAGFDGAIGADTSTVTVNTNLSGIATAVLNSGDKVYTYYINVTGASTTLQPAYIIHVQEGGGQDTCTSEKDCPDNYLCVDGQCEAQDPSKPCDDYNPCPAGYQCQSHLCVPASECPPGYKLELRTPCPGCTPEYECVYKGFPCEKDEDCPVGFMCKDHACVPTNERCDKNEDCPPGLICKDHACINCNTDQDCIDGGYPSDYKCLAGRCEKPTNCPEFKGLNVSGKRWYTDHLFDLSNAVGGFPKLAGPLDMIFQALMGNLGDISKIPIIGDILSSIVKELVKQYVPEWAINLISALNTLANMFQEMRVQGLMKINQLNPQEFFSGSEEWRSVIIYMISQCPQGRYDPNWPQCAEINIAVGSTGDIQVREVRPFTGRIVCDRLNFDDREVQMEVKKLITYVVNLVTQITTGYDTLIDCVAFAQAVDSAICGSNPGCIPLAIVEQACEVAKDQLPSTLLDWLDTAQDWTAFKFHGYGTATDIDSYKYAKKIKDGKWEGTVSVVLDGPLTGTWKAER